jgi:tripartite-type tricarboxylate transporter receptor subunit TctC
MGHVARAKPDGHTLLMVPFGLPVNQYLYESVPYDFEKDFSPIALVAKVPNAIVVRADSPLKTVKDYVELSKKTKEGITYSTPGVGSSLHLAGELFKYETKSNMLHVPYKGSAPSLMAVMSGDTDSAFENLSTAAKQIEAGKLRALAVTSKERSESFPDIPTVAESGYPQFEINSYFGLAAPAGTPKEIIETLNQAVMRAVAQPEMREYLNNLGAITEQNSPEEFGAFLSAEGRRWGPVIKAADIKRS